MPTAGPALALSSWPGFYSALVSQLAADPLKARDPREEDRPRSGREAPRGQGWDTGQERGLQGMLGDRVTPRGGEGRSLMSGARRTGRQGAARVNACMRIINTAQTHSCPQPLGPPAGASPCPWPGAHSSCPQPPGPRPVLPHSGQPWLRGGWEGRHLPIAPTPWGRQGTGNPVQTPAAPLPTHWPPYPRNKSH